MNGEERWAGEGVGDKGGLVSLLSLESQTCFSCEAFTL